MKGQGTTIAAIAAFLFVARAVSAASVDGARVQWTSEGTGGQTVIFVHGWTCDATSWNAQAPVMSQKYRVITLDLPGHGKSGSPTSGKLSMELFARAVEAVRNEANVDRVVLVGHSMGTPVIRQYALMYPQRGFGPRARRRTRSSSRWRPHRDAGAHDGRGGGEGARNHDPRHGHSSH